jgi:hypothetical protein
MRFAGRIGKVSQKGEVKIGIAIGEEAHLEIVNEFTHLLLVQKQGGNGDHGGALLRNMAIEVQLGQRLGVEDRRHRVVHQLNRTLHHGHDHEQERDGKLWKHGIVG